jgi:predicted metalloprotease
VHRRWLVGLVTAVVTVTAGFGGGGGGDGDGGGRGDGGRQISYPETIELTVEDVQDFWRQQLPRVFGMPYEAVSDVVGYGEDDDPPDVSECFADATEYDEISENAIYCPLDDVVAYDDDTLFPRFFDELGPFAIAFAISHEFGHAIQARTVGAPAFDGTIPTVFVETQADCYAGAWAEYVDSGGSRNLTLDPGDLEIGISGLLEVRDPVGGDPASEGAHGSGFDRVTAFQQGFEGGVDLCSRWLEEGPVITETVFTSPEDEARGGNLPFSQAVDLALENLDIYWSEVVTPFEAPGVEGFNPALERTLPECESLELDPDKDPDAYANSIFYCSDDETIYYDRKLLRSVHNDIGDLGSILLISNAYASAAQEQLGTEGDPLDLGLQADCFSGSWVGSIPIDNPPTTEARGQPVVFDFSIILSPGDLDEVVQSFLAFGDPPNAEEVARGTAFERITAFRSGFFAADPEATCASLLPTG